MGFENTKNMKKVGIILLIAFILGVFYKIYKVANIIIESEKKDFEKELKLTQDSLKYSREKSYHYFQVADKLLEVNKKFKSSREELKVDSTYLELTKKDFN